jgi:hypothetical protein
MSRFFDWKCDNCGTVKEVYENFNNEPHVCECGSEMKRIISNPPQHNFKDLPKGHNLGIKARKEAWESRDPKEFRQIM